MILFSAIINVHTMSLNRIKKSAHLVYWLLGEWWYSWYWHVILVEKYTSWWEDEAQVHFVRRSHVEAVVLWASRRSSSVAWRWRKLSTLLVENVVRRKLFKLAKSSKNLFCTLCSWISVSLSLSLSLFTVLWKCLQPSSCLGGGEAAAAVVSSRPSPTCFFASPHEEKIVCVV